MNYRHNTDPNLYRRGEGACCLGGLTADELPLAMRIKEKGSPYLFIILYC
jgi:hypothetical protein